MTDKTPETKTETVTGAAAAAAQLRSSAPISVGGFTSRAGVNANMPRGLGMDPKDVVKDESKKK
jgi:hypothetical protein